MALLAWLWWVCSFKISLFLPTVPSRPPHETFSIWGERLSLTRSFPHLPVSSDCYQLLCKHFMSRPLLAVSASLPDTFCPDAHHTRAATVYQGIYLFSRCPVYFFITSVIILVMALSRLGTKQPPVWGPSIILWSSVSLHSLHPIKGTMEESEWANTYRKGGVGGRGRWMNV